MTVLEEEGHFCFKIVVCCLTVDFHQMDIVPMVFIKVYFLEVVKETISEDASSTRVTYKRNQDHTGMVFKAF